LDFLYLPPASRAVNLQTERKFFLKKRIIVSVTNDLTSDKRVDRVCSTLGKMGFEVLLVGRQRKQSLPLRGRNYKTKRMHLMVEKGAGFYAEYNFRLFLFLLFHKADLLVSNDLDTLIANFLVSRIRGIPLVHDCHEYFRGVPELNGRKFPTRVWKRIEDWVFPKLNSVYAVNKSIAGLYSNEYRNMVEVIRNVPYRNQGITPRNHALLSISRDTRIILYQGSLNVDRGIEEAIRAMKHVKTRAILLVIGTGDVSRELKQLALLEGVSAKVIFTGEIPFQELFQYTQLADIGLSIEKDVSLNYHYCLPNKFLDYIQAGVPVLISPLPEMLAIVQQYQIGEMIENHDPANLAAKFDSLLSDETKLSFYKKNLEAAAAELCWENEEKKLMNIFSPYA
jgi:glycosyltransferase involved in cell wall biosynthesis